MKINFTSRYASVVGVGLAIAGLALTAIVPAHGQVVGGAVFADPVTFAQTVARNIMLAAGAVMVIAGGYKALQVWSGTRQIFDAATALLVGATLVFGTAAAIGFA